ncbi:MAG: sirohydrochlorin chelatase [Microlunatus sp.]|nr:sirohydrochlorin chelatase [Microlunatus sp.]
MTAPSLILVGRGGGDPRVAQVSQALRAQVGELRPGLDVHAAFTDNPPTALQVINKLTERGVTEVVLTPLSLSDAFSGGAELNDMLTAIRAAHPGLQVVASQPIGPDARLLTVVDRRLREELRRRRVTDLDALVFLADGRHDPRSHAIIARRARLWSAHHKLPSVTAFGGDHGPSAAEAVRSLLGQGRRHVAVGSWYLGPTGDYLEQARLASEAGALAVSEPLGAEPELVQSIVSRYVVSAMDLVDLEPLLTDRQSVPHLTAIGA